MISKVAVFNSHQIQVKPFPFQICGLFLHGSVDRKASPTSHVTPTDWWGKSFLHLAPQADLAEYTIRSAIAWLVPPSLPLS